MVKAVNLQDAQVYHLPGRDWSLLVGPQNADAKNLTLGLAVFPGGSAPDGHVHPAEEEVIYIISGAGELVTPEGTVRLETGTAVYIPPGLHHATVSSGPEPLELLSVFSPPVIPGSYEAGRSLALSEALSPSLRRRPARPGGRSSRPSRTPGEVIWAGRCRPLMC